MRRSFLLPALISFLAAPALGAPLQPERILGADTDLVLVIRDAGSFTRKLEASPWNRFWQEASQAIEAMPDSSREKAESGENILRTLSGLTGPVAMVLSLEDVTAGDLAGKHGPKPHWGVLAGSENAEAFASAVAKDENLFQGAAGGAAILAGSSDYLETLSALAKHGPGGEPLAGNPDWKTLARFEGESDASLFLNFRRPIQLLRDARQKYLEDAAAGGDPRLQAMGATPGGALDALALDSFRAMGFGVTVSKTETRLACGLLASGEKGLMKLMALLPGPCPQPDFIPAEAIQVSSGRFSFPKAWDALWEILDAMSPSVAGLLQTQLDQLTMAAGVDLRRDVIDHLGETVFSAAFPPASGTGAPGPKADQVLVFEVQDREAMETSVHTLLESLGAGDALQSREVAGTTVYGTGVPGAPAGANLDFAFTDRYFLLGMGTPAGLEEILRAMKHPGPSIWKRRDVAPYLAGIPEDASAVSITDLEALLGSTYDQLPESTRKDLPRDIWQDLAKSLGVAVSYEIRTPEGFFALSRFVHRKP